MRPFWEYLILVKDEQIPAARDDFATLPNSLRRLAKYSASQVIGSMEVASRHECLCHFATLSEMIVIVRGGLIFPSPIIGKGGLSITVFPRRARAKSAGMNYARAYAAYPPGHLGRKMADIRCQFGSSSRGF